MSETWESFLTPCFPLPSGSTDRQSQNLTESMSRMQGRYIDSSPFTDSPQDQRQPPSHLRPFCRVLNIRDNMLGFISLSHDHFTQPLKTSSGFCLVLECRSQSFFSSTKTQHNLNSPQSYLSPLSLSAGSTHSGISSAPLMPPAPSYLKASTPAGPFPLKKKYSFLTITPERNISWPAGSG